ncbi:hypothetical protein ACVV2G_17910 [Streptomyces ziwulingensis]
MDSVRVDGRARGAAWTGSRTAPRGGTLAFGPAERPDTRWVTDPADLRM